MHSALTVPSCRHRPWTQWRREHSGHRLRRMSHTVLLELNCKPGKGAEFLPALIAALADTRARQGAGAMEPYVDADNPDRLFVWEKWDSRSDQESYLQ